MTGKKTDTQTGPTPTHEGNTQAGGQAGGQVGSQTGASGSFGHTPLQGRAHIVNRGDLQDEASAGPGSLDPKTLAQPKVPEARRWLAKRGIELEIPAGWKYLGIGNEGRTLTFVSDTDASVVGGGHAVELHLWGMPDDLTPAQFLATQEEQLQEATELKRVVSWQRRTLGQVDGLVVVGWGPDSRDALRETSDEDLFLATDGTGRRALSWRGVIERPVERTGERTSENGADKGRERLLVMLALSSPIESFPDAKPVYEAMLDRCGVWQ